MSDIWEILTHSEAEWDADGVALLVIRLPFARSLNIIWLPKMSGPFVARSIHEY